MYLFNTSYHQALHFALPNFSIFHGLIENFTLEQPENPLSDKFPCSSEMSNRLLNPGAERTGLY